MLLDYFRSFYPRNQPGGTRQSYAHEFRAALTIPAAFSLMESGVVGILARKAFAVTPAQFAVIMSASSFAWVTSFLWTKFAHGRPKVRLIVALQILSLLSVASIAFLPMNATGALLLTVLIATQSCLMCGVITLRSTIWRMNYPRDARATITGRLTVIHSIIVGSIPLLAYSLLDQNPQAFRVIYPVSVLVAMIGVSAYSRIQVRGEAGLLRTERGEDLSDPETTEVDVEAQKNGASPEFWSVLRDDPLFRRYMIHQFILGSANMISMTVMVYLVADLTKGFSLAYMASIALTAAIPRLVGTIILPLWARYLDRVHITRFRVLQSFVLMSDHFVLWLGMLTMLWPLIILARIIQGVGRAGTLLAWNLGHNDFTQDHQVAGYMGVHVTLTGVRGAIGPFLGMLLFKGWAPVSVDVLGVTLPGFQGMGIHIFLLCLFMATSAWIGYQFLSRDVAAQPTTVMESQ
ncbi:MAG: MFS transporter [Planctomycetota bacterium]|jgi:MFS family permease|nr:MFS transporter [Planctomycetota bacterium]